MKKKKKPKKTPIGKLRTLRENKIANMLHEAETCRKNFRFQHAINIYREILTISPNNSSAISSLLNIYTYNKKYIEAEALAKEFLTRTPDNEDRSLELATIYIKQQKWPEAIDILNSILSRNPLNLYANHYLGYALRWNDDIEASIPYLRKVLDIDPLYTPAYQTLCAVLRKQNKNNELKDLLKQAESILDRLEGKSKASICFVLGKYYDYFDKYDTSFRWIELANKTKRKEFTNNLDYFLTLMQSLTEKIGKDFIQNYSKYGHNTTAPIFILGMPRSGTSLIEQILSCHPEVCALGEQLFIQQHSGVFDYKAPKTSTQMLADHYMREINKLRDERPYFTDKMPENFIFTGLLATAFPQAKIIHCKRNPLDTCFSCYQNDFEGSMYYTYDLESLAKFYLAYHKIMKHWQEVLPDRRLHVNYENTVSEFNQQVKRIIDYCNLPWDDACLKFYESKRITTTSSADQVNQPIYSSSVNRWKKYQKHLQPLIETLNPLI